MALTKNYMAEAYRLSRKRNAVISILILFTLQSKPEKGYRKLTNEDVNNNNPNWILCNIKFVNFKSINSAFETKVN